MKRHGRYILFLLLLTTCTLSAQADQTLPPSVYEPKPFSVSADKQVLFSSGNLQYNAVQGSHQCADGTTQPGTWRFAEHQWDYVGDAENGNVYQNGVKCDNALISDTYDGWIDLFGWSTAATYNGINNSTTNSDYSGNFVEWGNNIDEGWYTLSKDEWVYLFYGRPDAAHLFGMGSVNGVNGTILLPDNWAGAKFTDTDNGLADQGTYFYNENGTNSSFHTYTAEQWAAMEESGAVFLPTAGGRFGTDVRYVGSGGYYWSSTPYDESYAYGASFDSDRLRPQYHGNRYYGLSVRLVKKHTPPPPSAYEPKPFSISSDKQILFSSGNLQYNAAQGTHQCTDGTTQPGTWRFAEHQYDYVGEDNKNISDTYDGWIDLFGWGTSGWNSGANAYQPWTISTSNSDYLFGNNENNNLTGDFAYADWGQYNTINDDVSLTWRTLTDEEWHYLFEIRADAGSKYGAAKVNGIAGVVVLPDEWTLPSGLFTPGMTSASSADDWSDVASTNIYTAAQWQPMEANGAIFLPCAGSRLNAKVSNPGIYGYYWISTSSDSDKAYALRLHSDQLSIIPHNRCGGRSVRLAKDFTSPPPVLPSECLDNYDTVRFCTGFNAEHDELVQHGYCLRYLPYRYESPAEWDFMEGMILARDSDRTLVDLARAERNLRDHYTDDLTPVQSVRWSLCRNGTHDYHAITAESEPQWIEAGTLSLSVYFLCGQRYYTDFTTDIDDVVVSDKPVKVLMDGHIYILRGKHVYNAEGKMVR